MIAIKTVLVATDFSAPSETAVTYALNFARTFGARVHILTIVDDVATHATTLGPTAIDFGPFQAQVEDDARNRLEALVNASDRGTLDVQFMAVTSPSVSSTILAYAQDVHADLVIVGTHGRTGLKHFFLGSVAEQIVRLADCPVLTVRSPEREFIQPDALERTIAQPAVH